ncbi:DUF1993 family protein [Sinorhizobium chiapasense]|uniref:DUF1993 family protein n=1 Tax=Sinorhizobium chiapasense TaxID=501572 RepID=A0ABZ2BHP2_9HYPH
MSMSNASIPAFAIGLNTLSALLDKAEAHAEGKGIDRALLLNGRLFPDMFGGRWGLGECQRQPERAS